jgi:hypothetical protein
MGDFFRASSPSDAARPIDRIVKTGATFDEVHARLSAGRSYSGDVPKGDLTWQFRMPGGAALPTSLVVPADYDPRTKYPVRFYLHGGIARASIDTESTGPRRRRLEFSPAYLQVYPSGFIEAPWWSGAQLENFDKLLSRLKRTYNVDENRVHLMGVSDGGTGALFVGLRHATAWSVLYPLNGSIRVLANLGTGVDGELFFGNLTNVPLYMVNGGRDPLYPVAATEPFVAMLQRAGGSVLFRPQMNAGHDTSWWPTEREPIDEYERTHPRDPLPDRLSWQTERAERDNRFRWLVIESLDSRAPMVAEEDGFQHKKRSGRVELERQGNVVRARTRGVSAFTLLLSPADFDFEKPLAVTVNGRPAYNGPIKKDVRTLLAWAARDEDRTMLFGAALRIEVQQ